MADNTFSNGSASLVVSGSALGASLMNMLMADDIMPGSDPSYEICKLIYVSHPLGQKMAETPINIAQSQRRVVSIEDAPVEVVNEFLEEWDRLKADKLIHNTMRLSRIYGISAVVALIDGMGGNDTPIDRNDLWKHPINFNVLDPLNTAGSLVLSQIPTSPDFNKPVTVRASGMTFHPTRFEVMMNEQPVYLAYTSSAFGFVGRSVYQRALFPLKSFIRSMIADDMIATKLSLLVAKQKSPGSIIDNVMATISGLKRGLLQQAQNGQVLSIDTEEAIETLNMQNVDGAGSYSRTNIIKNVATAADMPAKLLDNETLVAGFGEGTEDAKNIARYIEGVRSTMEPLYDYFERIAQARAWNPDFYARLKKNNPSCVSGLSFEDARSLWCDSFVAKWPSLLIEPESEQVKVDDIKFQATAAFMQTLIPILDPENKSRMLEWASANISSNKRLFPHDLTLDLDAFQEFAEKQPVSDEASDVDKGIGPEAKKFGKFG
ncbi:MAG: anti-CBASS protein Acb1 family protein [Gammaproteobacteria bacterium]